MSVTPRLRPRRSPTAKLSESDIREILMAPESKTQEEWAEEKLCDQGTISDIVNGKSWTDVAPELPRRPRTKPRTSEDEIEHIRKLARNHPPAKVARMVGKLKTTVWRIVKRRTYREIY